MRFTRALRRRLGLARRPESYRADPWAWLDRRAAAATPRPTKSPIFIGGTGRSGTTITGRLVGAHPERRLIGTEVKFISMPGGLCDLVDGRTTFEEFRKTILGFWYRRSATHGLFTIMDRETIEAALPPLETGLRREPHLAARIFAHRLLDPIADASGAAGWIEMTPNNGLAAGTLMRIFPDMRLIHSVRDGRDVASSVLKVHWGPKDLDEALGWWARKLERTFIACDLLPADRVLVMQLEDLVARDREHQYRRLREFLGLDDDPAMRRFFDESMSADQGHFGRWRQDVPPELLASFDAHHRALAERLAERGRPYQALEALADTAA